MLAFLGEASLVSVGFCLLALHFCESSAQYYTLRAKYY